MLPKGSKECSECLRRYPTTCGVAACIACKKPLSRVQKEPTVTEDEWDALSFVYARVIPGPLPPEEREKVERDWEAVESEVARRGPLWSEADIIEGFPRLSDAAA